MLDPLSFPQPLVLDMGAGDVKTEGVTRVDAFFPDTDIVANMWDVPLPDDCVDVVYSNNALEHVGKNDVVPTLREWNRLLKHGGTLVLIVPDLEWACEFWLKCPTTEWPMDTIYGNQNHGGEFHKTGFTKDIIWQYLVVANPGGWFVNELEYVDGTGRYEVEYEPTNQEGVVNTWYKDVHQRLIRLVARKTTMQDLIDMGVIEPE